MAKKYLALTIDNVEMDISFGKDKATNTKNILVVCHSKNGDSVIDSKFIELNNVMLAVNKTSGETPLVLGANLGSEISLSSLPLIGDLFTKDQTIKIDSFQVLVSTADLDEKQVAMLQTIRPAEHISFPKRIQKGANLYIPENGSSQTADTLPDLSYQTTPSTQTTDTPPDESEGRKWISINKTLGPVIFKRIGVRYQTSEGNGPEIYFLLDAQMAMGPMAVSLSGLSFGTPIERFKPKFNLEGLALSFCQKPVQISGAFLPQREADGSYTYSGMAIIKTPSFSMTALGAYKDLDGQPSIFIYAVLDLTVGIGPSFFQFTGISMGFGYNRLIKIPEISQVKDFPLVSVVANGEDLGTDPMEVLEKIKTHLPAAKGEMLMAFGIKFTSFRMLESFALLILGIGSKTRLNLLGISKLSVPAKKALADVELAKKPLAEVELALKGSYDFYENSLKVEGTLTPASYVLSKSCRLTGDFAFYSWFAGEHAGDFVYTMGGYHPEFKVPAHYPKVPRLGFHWQVIPGLNLKGEMYFALTPSALMAGGRLEATYHFQASAAFNVEVLGVKLSGMTLYGEIEACFIFGADFIVAWQSCYYKADIYINVGIKVAFKGTAWVNLIFDEVSATVEKRFDVTLGANLRIRGPEFAGIAHVNWSIISFDIEFGNAETEPSELNWDEFRSSFLPAEDDKICTIAIEDGLTKEVETGTKKISVINPAELVLSTNSVIPSNDSNIKDDKNAIIKGNAFGIGCMNVQEVLKSKHTTQIFMEINSP